MYDTFSSGNGYAEYPRANTLIWDKGDDALEWEEISLEKTQAVLTDLALSLEGA